MTLIERLLAQANKEASELADLLNEAAKELAQPQQEPVYVQTRHKEEHGFSEWGSLLDLTHRNSKWAEGVEMRLLYTSQPARKPLTDMELELKEGDELAHIHPQGWNAVRRYARVIEAAHGIKDTPC